MGNPQSVPSSSQPFKDQAASQARSMGTSNRNPQSPQRCRSLPIPGRVRGRPLYRGPADRGRAFSVGGRAPAGGGKLRRQELHARSSNRLILHEKDREVFILLGQALNPRQLLQHDPCPVCQVQGKGVDRAFHMGGPYRIFLPSR